MERIGIVVLNYNSYSDSIRIVEDLKLQVGFDCFEIVIVDNNSPNCSYSILKNRFSFEKNIHVISSGYNLGYAKGNNYGLMYLEKYDCKYIAIINNDVYFLCNHVFESLIESYNVLDNVGIISPRQLDKYGLAVLENIYLSNRIPSFWEDIMMFSYFTRKVLSLQYKKKNIDLDASYIKSEIIPGSFMFTSFSFFKEINYFDTITFLFGEERCIAEKVIKKQKTNYILGNLQYIHYHSKTIKKEVDELKQYKYLYDSIIEYTKKYRVFGRFKSKLLSLLYGYSLKELSVLLKFKYGKSKR